MRQRWLALLGLVLVPYIKAKAEREYVRRRGGAAASMGLLDDSQVHMALTCWGVLNVAEALCRMQSKHLRAKWSGPA